MPILPEVFLDESYCHMHHNQNLTWLPKDGIVYEKGRGPMLVIFGAIVIFQDRNNNQIKGKLVHQSLLIWNPTAKPSTGKGRKKKFKRMGVVPDAIKNANIVPDEVDYRGNFNAEVFEKIFKNLCEILKSDYGPCIFHMDGARYHKHHAEPMPNSN